MAFAVPAKKCPTTKAVLNRRIPIHDFNNLTLSLSLFPPSLPPPESRPLSIPMKVMPTSTAVESWSTSEERMKALIAHAWDAVKRLTLQVLHHHISPYSGCFTSNLLQVVILALTLNRETVMLSHFNPFPSPHFCGG